MNQLQEPPLLTDVETLHRRASESPERGAVIDGSLANRESLLQMLDTALASELTCVLRYRRHHYMATGLHAETAAREFMEHSLQELDHADRIAARIVQLGGEPNFDPSSLTQRGHAEYSNSNDLGEMLRENLVAERVAIQSYREMIRFVRDDDPTTRRLLEDILAVEEEHADDLASLLQSPTSHPEGR